MVVFDPNQIKKSFLNTLKENGVSSAIKSAVLVAVVCLVNTYVSEKNTTAWYIFYLYVVFCFYFAFRSKFVAALKNRILRSTSGK
jgi:hypothetical protein